jgi:acyl-CoA thioester hydrolase
VRPRHAIHRVRVGYQDTDQGKVVHHASYLRFLEAARIEFWREGDFVYDRFEKETGLVLPVVEAELRYRSPARFDDLLEVETWLEKATQASVWVQGIIRRGETVLVESRIRLACVAPAAGRIRRIPAALIEASLVEDGDG